MTMSEGTAIDEDERHHGMTTRAPTKSQSKKVEPRTLSDELTFSWPPGEMLLEPPGRGP